MKRIDILKKSLENKKAKFDDKLNEHFESVKSANGQPLNDKRNGAATLRRWDKQNEALLRLQQEIEKTEEAITKEEWKQKSTKAQYENFPPEIVELIDNGVLRQWRKYPHILFVDGVDKARIIWDKHKKTVAYKFYSSITDMEQRRKFAEVYNKLYRTLK